MLTNKKRIPWNKGKKGLQKWSFETREKMKNRIPWNKGTIGLQKFSDTTKEELKLGLKIVNHAGGVISEDFKKEVIRLRSIQ